MEKNIENQNIKRRSTFAVLFYINRTKVRKDGMCQLLCKVSIDAEWAQIGTKVSVNPSIWNPDKGRADGRSENAVTVNRAIDDLTDEITGHYDRIKNSLGFITAELVKNAVKGIGQKPLTLLALFREHNEEFKKRSRDRPHTGNIRLLQAFLQAPFRFCSGEERRGGRDIEKP